MTRSDKAVLRRLGERVAMIADDPVHNETRDSWKALNGLRPTRPMFMIDQVCWNQMDVNSELTCLCEDSFARGIEIMLRRKIYHWDHMRDDKVVEPLVEIPKSFRTTGFGIEVDEDVAAFDPGNDVMGHYYHDQIKTDADLERIRAPRLTLDKEATERAEERAREVFDGILDVRMQGIEARYNMWDTIVNWRGPEAVLYDLVDRPEFMHEICRRTTAAHMTWLEQAESEGLLQTLQSEVHCTGAFTDELPPPGADLERPRARDVWTFGMSQLFSSVSPRMHEEFEYPYLSQWFKRFGMVYYGCCEPLDRKIDMIRRLPKVRKVSMSPWVDVRRGAAGIGGDFVFSRKPSPALVAADAFDFAAVEADLRTTLDSCREFGCPCELILKDISTVRYEPQRLWQWSTIARRLVEEYST